MHAKWVDTPSYFGADRRRAAARVRLWKKERRVVDRAGDQAPLGTLLRRLRVQLMGFQNSEHRELALQLVRAAARQAEARKLYACADEIKEAGRVISVARFKDRAELAKADARLVSAMELLGFER